MLKTVYTTMSTFLFTGELFQGANLVGINPDLPILPSYIGFQEDDVQKYGYFLLFVMNLPLYAEAIWYNKIAYYRNVQPQEEQKKLMNKKMKNMKKIYLDTESDTANDDGHEAKESKDKKEIPATCAFSKERYCIQDMKLYKNLPPVFFKRTIKRVKRGQGPYKTLTDVCDELPWDNGGNKMEDLPINPSIAEMWHCLFNNE
jgi:hypothetical protein